MVIIGITKVLQFLCWRYWKISCNLSNFSWTQF